jgi:hypothetical protein
MKKLAEAQEAQGYEMNSITPGGLPGAYSIHILPLERAKDYDEVEKFNRQMKELEKRPL